MKKTTRAEVPKRGYSRAFTPPDGEGAEYKIRRIPRGLWRQVQTRAKREGVSLRALILAGLREWVEAPPATPPFVADHRGRGGRV